MGDGKSNFYLRGHTMDGDSLGDDWWRIRYHDAAVPEDTESPQINGVEAASLANATDSQTSFDDAVDEIGGTFATWYNTLSSTVTVEMRLAVMRWP